MAGSCACPRPAMPVIGFLHSASARSFWHPFVAAFRDGLGETGYAKAETWSSSTVGLPAGRSYCPLLQRSWCGIRLRCWLRPEQSFGSDGQTRDFDDPDRISGRRRCGQAGYC